LTISKITSTSGAASTVPTAATAGTASTVSSAAVLDAVASSLLSTGGTTSTASTGAGAASPPPTGSKTVFNVSTTAGLDAALKAAKGGDTIDLAPGAYRGVAFSNLNYSSNVTIQSSSSSGEAAINELIGNNDSNITFSNVKFTSAGSTYGANFHSSSNVKFVNDAFQGTKTSNSQSWGDGLFSENSNSISVTGSTFNQLTTGLAVSFGSGFNVQNNSFTNIGQWGIAQAQVTNDVINNNSFSSFFPGTGIHSDAVIIFTTGTTQPSSNITIDSNTITQGSGQTNLQGIFLTDELGDLTYKNVQIANNTISNIGLTAIGVGNGDGVQISGNKISSASSASNIVVETANGLTLSNNAASNYEFLNINSITDSGNLMNGVALAQNITLTTNSNLGNNDPLATNITLAGGAKEVFANSLNDTISGNNLGDTLIGEAGNDTLIGGTGNDVLESGSGNDTMRGGGGTNAFTFGTKLGQDVIADLSAGVGDTININALKLAGHIASLSQSGANTVIGFSGSTGTITLDNVKTTQLAATASGFKFV
jgi:RTX calcium-binding nonapeptide repeat (4 copies)/Right handed beta helix region